MRRRLAASLLLLLFLCPAAFARRQQQPAAPRLVDSFDDRILLTDLKARLDNFAIELQDAPEAKGFVVVYGARHKFPGWPVRRARACLDFLANVRGLGAQRVSMVNGGLRDDTAFEFWLVPAGASLAVKPFDIALLMSGEKRPLPFDRFDVVERGDEPNAEEGEYYPDAEGLYDYLAEVMRADPSLRACVIAYTSRRGPRTADRRMAANAKRAVVKSQAVDVRRVVAIGGGRREYKAIEVWLVPPGAELPKPTPEVRRARGRRRR